VRWRGKTTFGKPAAHVGDKDQYIGHQVASDDQQRPDYSSPGLNHFGIVVESLAKARETLAKRGIPPHNEPEYEPGRRFYFFDPNGVEVELIEYADGA
jgi:glyoxylase I family protein